MELTPAAQKFIVHWGEMGEKWGINRTIAQIHGLLYLSPKPLNAEEISETLSLARSTVSVGLRELESWGIIRVVHVLGDRTDHFEVKGDAYEMFRFIVDYRKRREVDPTLHMLREVGGGTRRPMRTPTPGKRCNPCSTCSRFPTRSTSRSRRFPPRPSSALRRWAMWLAKS